MRAAKIISIYATCLIALSIIGFRSNQLANLHTEISVDLDNIEYFACYNLKTTFLTGAAGGGFWTAISVPAGSTLTDSDLCGAVQDCLEDPCIDFDFYGCGNYTLRYSVESDVCVDCFSTTDITFYKCCLTASVTCS